MITKLSRKMSGYFIRKQMVKEEEREVYDYCFEIFISTIVNTLAVVIIAISTAKYIESLLFLLAFVTVRAFSGGAHAKTHFMCFMSLMIIYSGLQLCLWFLPFEVMKYASISFIVIADLLILILSPVEHPNKLLDDSEKKINRIKAYLALLVFNITSIPMMFFQTTIVYAYSINYTLFVIAIMQVIGLIVLKKSK